MGWKGGREGRQWERYLGADRQRQQAAPSKLADADVSTAKLDRDVAGGLSKLSTEDWEAKETEFCPINRGGLGPES